MPVLFFLFLLSFSFCVQSETSIQGNEGKLLFVDKIDETIGDDVIAIFFDDKHGERYFVDYLPYLSSKGKIHDGFYLNTETLGARYFVIQQSQIDSDTGMNWFNYFNVVVFSYLNGKLMKDDKLTSYFGSGGDIINPNGANSIPYVFPYSEQENIIKAVSKPEFEAWMKGHNVRLTITGKSHFFPEPLPINRTKSYLVEGDIVLREKHESGWDYIIYKSAKGREYSGWMPCSLTGSC
ncbi:hypothetical protein [Aeromonas caviae]|uniref:hypothetical protein n=1 Tax=Aeromonas caviae TaxID=648 RepID=UPI00191E3F71|nr:hypothetical protein [Aeromonas caviae]MBL0655916.1 hypothetical protein [Aeromonas caviae]